MKLKKAAVCFILPFILFSGCLFNNTAVSTANRKSNTHYPLGSNEYVNHILEIVTGSGYKAGLEAVMKDVNKYGCELDHNNQTNINRFYRLVSYIIGKTGYIDQKTHYFRNKLNRAPATLDQLLRQNTSLPYQKCWKLLQVKDSLYHLQGADGIYNLKFISGDGFCEAVYNKKGILLTERNDPVNMGTFNYAAGINQPNSHHRYDVDPYLKWGNTPNSSQRGSIAIRQATTQVYRNYLKHYASVNLYRKWILSRYTSGRKA